MNHTASRRALIVLLLASMVLVGFVLKPLGEGLFLGAVFSAALYPLQRRLARRTRRPKVAALLLISGVVLLALAPLVTLSAVVVRETAEATRFVTKTIRSEGVDALLARLPDPLEKAARRVIDVFPSDENDSIDETMQEKATQAGGKAAAVVGAAVSATGSLLFQIVMMLIAMFFFLTQASDITAWLDHASPLPPEQTRELIEEFRRVSGSVLRSTVLTAAVQAFAACVGYLIASVPHPIFFTGLTFFVAMVPAIGAASVCLATALLLLFTGSTWSALFLALWGVIVVGLSDNIMKPILMKGDIGLHGAVVFFSLLGGLAAFGAIGLLVGPLAIALFVATLRIYRRDYAPAWSTPST
jgi:predicted PurR-regulated permease PerM